MGRRLLDQVRQGGIVKAIQPGEEKTIYLLSSSGSSECDTSDPEMVTMSVLASPTPNITPPSTSSPRIQCRVQWGTGKAALTAVFDVGQGARASFEATTLQASILYAGDGPPFDVAAGIAYGTRSGGATDLRFSGNLLVASWVAAQDGGWSPRVALPAFAYSVMCIPLSQLGWTSPWWLEFFSDNNTTSTPMATVDGAAARGSSIPIPNGAYIMRILLPSDPGAKLALTPVYSLCL